MKLISASFILLLIAALSSCAVKESDRKLWGLLNGRKLPVAAGLLKISLKPSGAAIIEL